MKRTHVRRGILRGMAIAGMAGGAALLGPSALRAQSNSRRIALVLGSGRGDLGWNDLAWFGAEAAKKQKVIDDYRLFTSTENEALSLFRELASSKQYRVIVSNSSAFVRVLPAVANEFPDQNYAQIDSRPRLEPTDPGNAAVLGVVFNQEQISALAGVLSAQVAAHHDFERVGIVLGREIAVLYDFEMGFKWGVEWGLNWLERNHPDALRGKKIAALKRQERVLWTYVGVWDDPAKGKTATQVQLRQGAGIVYQVAGGTGLGVLAAVDDAHKAGAIPIGKPPFAIGVDAVQDWINPHILASGIKRVDTAVFTAIKLAMDGAFRETIAKNNGRLALNLTNGGVALSNEEMLANTLDFAKSAARIREDQFPTILANYRKLRGEQPAHAWRALDQLAEAIKAGSAEIPRPSADPQKYDIKQLREHYG